MTTLIAKEREVKDRKRTIVRRVSDLFKVSADEIKFGPPSLFRHGSMQALRHCCQNLNLFPYLLHSFARNAKEHPIPILKSNTSLAIIVTRVTERIFRVYANVTQTIICGLRLRSMTTSTIATDVITKKFNDVKFCKKDIGKTEISTVETSTKFEKFEPQKPKINSWLLTIAVYLAPFILGLQIVGVFSLIVFGKYSPGFVFLVLALFFLGYISMKVLNHDNETVNTYKRDKRKSE